MSRYLKVKPLRYVTWNEYMLISATAHPDEFVEIQIEDEPEALHRGLERKDHILVAQNEKTNH